MQFFLLKPRLEKLGKDLCYENVTFRTKTLHVYTILSEEDILNSQSFNFV